MILQTVQPRLMYRFLYSFVFRTPWEWHLDTRTCGSYLCTVCNLISCICYWMWLITLIMYGMNIEFTSNYMFNASFSPITKDDSQYSTNMPAIIVVVDAWVQKQANQITFGLQYVYVIHLQLKPPLSSQVPTFPISLMNTFCFQCLFYASCLSAVRCGMFLPSCLVWSSFQQVIEDIPI